MIEIYVDPEKWKKTVKWWQKFLIGVSASGAPHALRHANPERYGLCGTGKY